MTIKEMHIGLDLILQKSDSNIFKRLLREEKDLFFNVVTSQIIRASLLDERNTVYNIVSYGNIRSYYEALQYYIREVELTIHANLGKPYIYGELPSNISTNVLSSGVLHKGIPYKVLTPGEPELNLAEAGGPISAQAGDIFTCNPSFIGITGTMYVGETYRILNAANYDFTTNGASSNTPGTVFVCTTPGVISGDLGGEPAALEMSEGSTLGLDVQGPVLVERLTVLPNWGGSEGAQLVPTSNFGYFNYLSSKSSVKYGQAISSGKLEIGKKYFVQNSGTTDLTAVGGRSVNDPGFIFTCVTDDDITWAGGTVLYEVLDAPNRIVKYQDIQNFLDHSYGTTTSSPISSISGNKLNVYHNHKFRIYRLTLDYVKEPITVSLENNVSSDLPVSMHEVLVDTTAKYILSTYGSTNQVQQQQQQQ